MLIVIDFIDDEDQGFVYAAEALSEIEIYWGDAVLAIDYKEEEITGCQGDLDFCVDLVGKIGVDLSPDSAGVDDFERRFA